MLRIKSMLSLYLAGLHTYEPFSSSAAFLKLVILYVVILAYPGCCYTVFKASGFYMTVSFSLQAIIEDLFRIDLTILILILSTLCLLPIIAFIVHITILSKKSHNSKNLYFTKKDEILFKIFIWLMEFYEALLPMIICEVLNIWRNFRYDLGVCELDSDGLYTIFPNKNYIFVSRSPIYYLTAAYATVSYIFAVLLVLFYSLFRCNEYSSTGNSFQSNLMHFIRNILLTYLSITYVIEPVVFP